MHFSVTSTIGTKNVYCSSLRSYVLRSYVHVHALNSVFSTLALILYIRCFFYTVDEYRSQLINALSGVDDILGGFDLPRDQMVPSYGVWYSNACAHNS